MWLAYSPSTGLQCLADRDDLVGCRVGAGRIDEARAHAPRPVRERRRCRIAHPVELGGGCRSILRPEHGHPQHPVANEGDAVDRGLGLVEAVEILPERLPRPVQFRPETCAGSSLVIGETGVAGEWRGRIAAVTDDLGRHALGERVDRIGV